MILSWVFDGDGDIILCVNVCAIIIMQVDINLKIKSDLFCEESQQGHCFKYLTQKKINKNRCRWIKRTLWQKYIKNRRFWENCLKPSHGIVTI